MIFDNGYPRLARAFRFSPTPRFVIPVTRCCVSDALPPVAFDPVPLVAMMAPVTWLPSSVAALDWCPAAADPHEITTTPLPVTGDPDVPGSRRYADDFHPFGRRPPFDDHCSGGRRRHACQRAGEQYRCNCEGTRLHELSHRQGSGSRSRVRVPDRREDRSRVKPDERPGQG